ncbi:MAG TPA: DUF2339 domain-containing protein, partial [Bacteroidia bacterium]|nr:DUF2339 domain-containing protein [Bacteroidia bacterium]
MLGILGLLLLAWLIISVYAFLSSLNQREKISRLEESVRNLREEIRRGNARNPEPEKAETSGSPVSIPQLPPVSPVSPPVFNKQAEPLSETPFIVKETIREEDVPKFQEAPEARTPGRTQAEWEALIGGKILNRIGALALIIGVGFFLKYAFDNNWITETMRVLIGVATGAGLLIGGHYFQKKNYRIFSQGLAGSGIAILYLSVYSAFNFYHLVPQISAMFMMSAVTAITFWQAFKYDSQVIALFGWLGGFLTPFLLSTGLANETGLFSYISLLNFGLLFIATKKEKWFLLEPLCLLATILVFSLWFGEFYTDEALWITSGFSAVFWLLFMSVEIRRIVNTGTPVYFHHQISSLVNGAFLYFSLYSAINPRHHEWMGFVALLMAVVYFVLFLWIKKKRPGDQLIQVRYLLSAVLLSVLAAGIQFKELEISIAWAIESFVLVVIAVRYRHLVTLLSGLFILILAAFAFTASNDGFEIPFTRYHFLYNIRALSLLTMFLSAYFSERIVRNFKQHYSSQIKTGLCYLWMLFLTVLITIETQNYSGQLAYIAETPYSSWIERMTAYVLAMEWMLLSIVLWYSAGRTQNRALSHGAFVLLCIG